ncbi:hypothetical protein ACM61V_03790 [Sphingomonas sp. TX0543]|uniref:hypothetical protein n=1 Tax=Sphingomonas sp. TX0543 TaxID=3399682 RepID=UPI003AFB78F4
MQNFLARERAGSLAGKRILFFSVRYFGYEQQIMAELRARGAEVDYLPDRPFNTPLMTAITRYSRAAVMRFADRFYRRKLAEFGNRQYDLVFVVNGQTLSNGLLKEMRARMPSARFLFYIWDSMRNKPKAQEILPFFDECVTFDPDAAQRYGMRLLPLFFAPGFEPSDGAPKYDLSFIGTAHSDRFHIISTINKGLAPDVPRFWYLFLQAPWVFYAQKAINPAFRNAKYDDFRYEPLPFPTVQQTFARSRAIVDMEHPHQTGLTMRTFEAIGASKKLITTNSHIRDYDFYDPQNIHIIDRADPAIPEDFLKTPYRALPGVIQYKYSLPGWIDNVLENSL